MAKASAAKGTTTMERLARWACELNAKSIGTPEIEQAKLLVLDTVGCAIAGWIEHSAAGVVSMVERTGGTPQCQVIASPLRTSVPNAVLANGSLCRVLDLNDYVLTREGAEVKLGGHPSDNIPVALAFAELAGSSGRDTLASIVIGYEIFGRAKDLGSDYGEWDGVSYSGLVAPAVGGRLMRLDAEQIAHALSLSAARCATSAIVRAGDLSAAKSIANALVAHSGAEATLLASHGLTGPLAIADHARGMKTLFANKEAIAALTAPMPAAGKGYILQASIKPYPSVATSQAAVAAGIALHDKLGAGVAKIERVRVVMADYPTIKRHLGDKERADPKSKEAADHSVPFLVAASILDGAMGHAQFDDERWNKPDVRRLMSTMELTTESAIASRAPDSYPCRLEAIDTSGAKHVSEVLFPPGLSRGGLAAADVVAKFHRITDDAIGVADRNRIVDAVMALPAADDIRGLMSALAVRRR